MNEFYLLTAARLAVAATTDEPTLAGWSFDALHEGETQAFGCVNDDGYRVIVFPGTASMEDLRTDLKAWTVKRYPPGRWHSGISEAFDQVAPNIRRWGLGLRFTSPYSLGLVGHSLGGGLATVAASNCLWAGRYCHLITFGCPRVCTYRAAQWMRQRLAASLAVRVVHRGDPVPTLPWVVGLQRGLYWHPIPATVIGSRRPDLKLDHPIAAYLKTIESALAESRA